MRLVIDASVSLKWILGVDGNEHNLAEAERILEGVCEGRIVAIQPPHWIAEVLSVIALKRPEKLDATLDVLKALPHQTRTTFETYRRAAHLSAQLDRHMFDTLYHAVAIVNDATLITADEKYFAKAYGRGNIQILANFSVQ